MTSIYGWGVDVDAHGIAIGVLDGGKVQTERRVKVAKSGVLAGKLHRLHDAIRVEMEDLGVVMPPSIITVEQPVGRWPAPTLVAAWGITLLAAHRIAGDAVVTMVPTEWRGDVHLKDVEDPGDALIDEAIRELGRELRQDHPLRQPVKRRAVALAREHGYRGLDTDIADAICIGLAGETREGHKRRAEVAA